MAHASLAKAVAAASSNVGLALAQDRTPVSAAGAKGVADSSGELSIASPVEGRVRSSIPDADVVTAPASSNQQSPETVARAAARESSAQPATNATARGGLLSPAESVMAPVGISSRVENGISTSPRTVEDSPMSGFSLYGSILNNLRLYHGVREVGFEFALNPTTAELHRVDAATLWGFHNLAIADLDDLIGLTNVALIPAHVYFDGTLLPVFDVVTVQRAEPYRLNKCRHWFPKRNVQPAVAPDRGGMTVSRSSMSHQRRRQLNGIAHSRKCA
jgi:hypothetical protein